jgi:serine/threonine-protein kinase
MPQPPSRPSATGTSSTGSRLQTTSVPRGARFSPGTFLAGRYQIVGLLGKGGMGEVYRANDMTLDQEVALKFLPESMTGNPAMLSRFHAEVRIARQISHPNVCRVYDIGEVDGQLFLSMEYVDGEDLGSLLRRIGRLSSDKGVEFARKICAGLAAAHDKGVLHRDLKPANIMIDSRGRVVIMDFGLAAVSDEVHGLEIRAGTPAYMSPEQLSGREVTLRSDIYALGLVLYEIFTGKRPFEGNSIAELMERQQQTQALSMTTVVRDLDHAVEAVITRCLSPDPKDRPNSALAVSAALPGGDPLAAALAAGDTPSPELVAASGQTAAMRPGIAAACGVAVLLLLIAIVLLAPRTRLLSRVPMELPPDALSLKATEVAEQAGYTERPEDTARGFLVDFDYLRYLRRSDWPDKWSQLSNGRPAAIVFWYRQSPRPLEPYSDRGPVTAGDPPQRVSGEIGVQLDPKGRLVAFTAVPPQVDEIAAAGAPDWNGLFVAAGLDRGKFTETAPTWTPLAMTDTRAAWTGEWPELPGQPLRVEGASWRGRVVYFDLIGPWTRPERMQRATMTRAERTLLFILLFFAVGMLLAATLLARYNLRRGRGDRRGAIRLAAAGFFISLGSWAISTDFVPTAGQVVRLFGAVAFALLIGGHLWLGYMALEPYVRRHWPVAIISWSRLMAGGVRDPLVGRDVLIGVLIGLLSSVAVALSVLFGMDTTGPSTQTLMPSLLGPRYTVASAVRVLPGSVIQLFAIFFLLFIARLVLRKEWLAAGGFIGLFTLINVVASETPLVDSIFAFLLATLMYVAVTKYGLVTFGVSTYVNALLMLLPVTADFSEWYAGGAVFAMVLVAAMAAYGLHTALAGRSIIQDDLL